MTPRTMSMLMLLSCSAWAQDPTPPPLISPGPAAAACRSYADCTPGMMCFAGACEPSCSTHEDCAQGLHCVGRREVETGKWARGVCRDGSRGATCEGPRDCGSGLSCTGRRALTDASGFESFCEEKGMRGESLGRKQGPQRYAYQDPAPAGFHVVTEYSRTLIGAGAGTLFGGYVFALFAGLISGVPLGAIPLIGPFFLGASWWSPSTGALAGSANFSVVLVVGLDFIAQALGVTLLSVALASPNHWLEQNVVTKPVVMIVPGSAGSPLGASFVGRF